MGCWGVCRGTEGLWSITTTDDIGGLSTGTSWTHNSATWMHLNTSLFEQFSKVGSTISKIVPLLQYSHTCNQRIHLYWLVYKKGITKEVKLGTILSKSESKHDEFNGFGLDISVTCQIRIHNWNIYKLIMFKLLVFRNI